MARRAKRGISPFYNRITLFFLILAVGFLSLVVFNLFEKEREAGMRRAEAFREFKSVEERERVLDADLAVLNTSRGQEALVRNTFDVAKEGEEVIVVLDALPATTTPKESPKGLIPWFLSLFE
tara:strand:- start:331759 stop:332127 length:369 start_codon:yes stop_codon:yes gene_type:complete